MFPQDDQAARKRNTLVTSLCQQLVDESDDVREVARIIVERHIAPGRDPGIKVCEITLDARIDRAGRRSRSKAIGSDQRTRGPLPARSRRRPVSLAAARLALSFLSEGATHHGVVGRAKLAIVRVD